MKIKQHFLKIRDIKEKAITIKNKIFSLFHTNTRTNTNKSITRARAHTNTKHWVWKPCSMCTHNAKSAPFPERPNSSINHPIEKIYSPLIYWARHVAIVGASWPRPLYVTWHHFLPMLSRMQLALFNIIYIIYKNT